MCVFSFNYPLLLNAITCLFLVDLTTPLLTGILNKLHCFILFTQYLAKSSHSKKWPSTNIIL